MRDAYLAQGLAVLTLGIMVVYSGVTRGVLLCVESLFPRHGRHLRAPASSSRPPAYIAAFFSPPSSSSLKSAMPAATPGCSASAAPASCSSMPGGRAVTSPRRSRASASSSPPPIIARWPSASSPPPWPPSSATAPCRRTSPSSPSRSRSPSTSFPSTSSRPLSAADPSHRRAGPRSLPRGNRRDAAPLQHHLGRGPLPSYSSPGGRASRVTPLWPVDRRA